MTELEKQIIELIHKNKYLSEDLKKRYILSMFLMESDKQHEYLRLIQAFTRRCEEMNRGIFVVHPNEMKNVMRTYEEVKRDILKKINTNNPNQ